MVSIPQLERSPGGRIWQPTPVVLSGKSHRQRSLAGYSPWGQRESDMTEQLSKHYILNSRDFISGNGHSSGCVRLLVNKYIWEGILLSEYSQ